MQIKNKHRINVSAKSGADELIKTPTELPTIIIGSIIKATL